MPEQNAGSIVYDISADVAPLLKGEQQASAALGNIGTSAVDTASKFKTLDTQVSKTASGVRTESPRII